MRKSRSVVVAAIPFLLGACTASHGEKLAAGAAVETKVAARKVALADHPGAALPTARGEFFSASGACAVCHRNAVDESGADVSNGSYWRSTMMANAARDPYWQASVRAEVLANPEHEQVIEDKCTICHMPMARFTAAAKGGQGKAFGDGFLDAENKLHSLAVDGVSCTVCHQIRADRLGERQSFSGGFVIDKETTWGKRELFGPFAMEAGLARLMASVSGFMPVEGRHLKQAEVCATCHTLYTPTIDAAGKIVGEFPEQTVYLEWLRSDYRETRSCQNCHMPAAHGGVRLSVTGGKPRSPFAKHVFVGGNAYMLAVLKNFGEELGVTASSAQFDATIERTRDQLGKRTATLSLEHVNLAESVLTADVGVQSHVGHKFPGGFPARRAWLHVVVRDAGGSVVFESGAARPDGAIAGNENDSTPGGYEPHYQLIEHPDQVQIYEAIIKDAAGKVTTALLRGAGYVRDNRLLPRGFDKDSAPPDIAVRGRALADEDFRGGGDRVKYSVDVGDAQGPFSITAELLYQAIGYRWAQNLRAHEAPEIERFLRYYEAVPNTPVVVASATATAEKRD